MIMPSYIFDASFLASSRYTYQLVFVSSKQLPNHYGRARCRLFITLKLWLLCVSTGQKKKEAPKPIPISSMGPSQPYVHDDWLRRPIEREESDVFPNTASNNDEANKNTVSCSEPPKQIVFQKQVAKPVAAATELLGITTNDTSDESKTCSLTQSTYTAQDTTLTPINYDSLVDLRLDSSDPNALLDASSYHDKDDEPVLRTSSATEPFPSRTDEDRWMNQARQELRSIDPSLRHVQSEQPRHRRPPEPLRNDCYGRRNLNSPVDDDQLYSNRMPEPTYQCSVFSADTSCSTRDEPECWRQWDGLSSELPRQSTRSFYSSTSNGSQNGPSERLYPRADNDNRFVPFCPSNHSNRRSDPYYDRSQPGAFNLRHPPRVRPPFYNNGSPSGADSTMSQQPQRRDPRPYHHEVMVEISPGFQVPLRRAQETVKAISVDFYAPITCFACTKDILCIADVSYVICPGCKTVSPVEGETFEGRQLRRFGLGLGFTWETLLTTQAEILQERNSRHTRQTVY